MVTTASAPSPVRLVVVLDDRLRERANGGFDGIAQLTPGLRELLEDDGFDIELWCREWQGGPGHITEVQKSVHVRHLPRWTRVGILWAVPRLLLEARRLRRSGSHILSVGPSFSQLALLLAKRPRGSAPEGSGVTWLVRSDPAASLMLTREASNAAVRSAIRVFCAWWRRLIRRQNDVVCVSKAVANEIGLVGSTIAPEIGWDELKDPGILPRERRNGALFVGRLSPEKGPDIAVDAFLGMSGASTESESLTIVGTGDMERELRERAEPLGDRVQFVGAQSRDVVSALMNAASVVLVPSRSEGFGLAAFEAAASGAVVIHSAVGGLTEACGWWQLSRGLPLDDLDIWSRAIETAFADPGSLSAPAASEIRAATGWPSLRELMRERISN